MISVSYLLGAHHKTNWMNLVTVSERENSEQHTNWLQKRSILGDGFWVFSTIVLSLFKRSLIREVTLTGIPKYLLNPPSPFSLGTPKLYVHFNYTYQCMEEIFSLLRMEHRILGHLWQRWRHTGTRSWDHWLLGLSPGIQTHREHLLVE